MLTLEQIEEIERALEGAWSGKLEWIHAEHRLVNNSRALLRAARSIAEASTDAEEIARRIHAEAVRWSRARGSHAYVEEDAARIIAAALARQRGLRQEALDNGTELANKLIRAEAQRGEDEALMRDCLSIFGVQPDLIRTDTGERGDGELNEICYRLRTRIGEGNKQ